MDDSEGERTDGGRIKYNKKQTEQWNGGWGWGVGGQGGPSSGQQATASLHLDIQHLEVGGSPGGVSPTLKQQRSNLL